MMPDPLEAFGLMPIVISTQISAQSQRPLAIVVSPGGAGDPGAKARAAAGPDCHRRLRLAAPSPSMPVR